MSGASLAPQAAAGISPGRRRRWPIVETLAVVLAVTALVASAWTAQRVFETLPHLEDEIANLWQAEVMAKGHIDLASPPAPRSFLVPFVVDYEGHRFGKYPPGWPAALSLGVRAGAPWLVNPILAGLSAWLVFRLGSKIFGRGVGLLAEALAIASPMFLMLSGSMMGHSLSLFLACAFWLAWIDLFSLDDPSQGVPAPLLAAVAGLSLGLLALTRPLTAVGVVLPCAVHAVILLLRRGASVLGRLLSVAALAVAVTALLPLWQAALTGDPWLNPYTLWWPYDRLGFGPGIGSTKSGHNLFWALTNTRFSLRAGLHDLFGWPYLSWLFLPFGLVATRKRWQGWLVFSTFPSLVGTYMIYWIGSWLLGPRYYYEALPGLAVLSAAGVAWLGGWLGGKAAHASGIRHALVMLLLALLVTGNLAFYLPQRVGGLRGLYGISRQRVAPFERADLGRALVFVHTQRDWTDYGTLLTLTPPFADSDLLILYSRGLAEDSAVASLYPGWPAYHYYSDQPQTFFARPR